MPSLGHDLFYSAWFRDFVWNLTSRVPVLCSQPMSVIIPVVRLEVYSQMSLVELVRGAVSSTQQQQNTAAPHPTIIGRLAQGIELSCALVTKKPDLPNLDHDAEKDVEGGQAEVNKI